MAIESLAAALEHEHREIDQGIEAFASGLAAGESQPEPLTRAMHALRRHIYLEEQFLFPPLREAGLVAPVLVMLREHGQIWKTLDALELELTRGTVSASMLKVCRDLTVQLQHHNLKEEKILYPQADQVLTASANAELRAFLDFGKLPEGWVCERAHS
jgi:iron-sulfur cluster repair protein YtfE (RIC family)